MARMNRATADEVGRMLESLARLPPGPPIVSAYLDTRWDDEQQRERLRIVVKHRVQQIREAYRGHPDAAGIDESLGRLEGHVAFLTSQVDDELVARNGVAVFASAPLGLWVQVVSPTPFATEVTVGDRPRLLPLARLIDDYAPALVVIVDPKALRIFEIALGGLVDEQTLEQELPQHIQVSGHGHQRGPQMPRGGALSQIQYQRYLKALREQNLKEGVEFLRRLAQGSPAARIILAGDPEAVGQLRSKLPLELERKVIDETRLADKEPAHRVLARALEILEAHERESEAEGVEEVIGLALGGRLAVLGPEDTLMALNEGRVHRLFLRDEGALGNGWRCTACGAVGEKGHPGCPYCGGTTTTVDLAEEMVRRAVEQGADVEHVMHSARLDHFGGMGALLRHGRAPTAPGVGHAEHFSMPAEEW